MEKKHRTVRVPNVNNKYTKGMRDRVLSFVAQGFNQKEAALMSGISEQTLCTWKNEHPEFCEELARAKCELRGLALRTLNDMALNSTKDATRLKAAMFILERQNPEEWGEKKQVTIQGAHDQSPMDILLGNQEPVLGKEEGKTDGIQ